MCAQDKVSAYTVAPRATLLNNILGLAYAILHGPVRFNIFQFLELKPHITTKTLPTAALLPSIPFSLHICSLLSSLCTHSSGSPPWLPGWFRHPPWDWQSLGLISPGLYPCPCASSPSLALTTGLSLPDDGSSPQGGRAGCLLCSPVTQHRDSAADAQWPVHPSIHSISILFNYC